MIRKREFIVLYVGELAVTKKELKKISLQYRTLASQMLKMNSQDEIYCMKQFYDFITETPYLLEYVQSCKGEELDFKTTLSQKGYGGVLLLPSKQEELVDYGYQLLGYLLDGPKNLNGITLGYSNSRKFADCIEAFMRKTIEPFVVALRTYIELSYIDIEDQDVDLNSDETTIFLSYCQQESDVADFIEEGLNAAVKGKAKISRDIRDVEYHQSFKSFMQSIEKHDYVVMIISDSYLKSRNCMYEMLEVIKDSNFRNKLLFVVLSGEDVKFYNDFNGRTIAADVYSSEGTFKYTKYWRDVESELQRKIDELGDPTVSIGLIKELHLVKKILLDLNELLEFIKDNKGLPLSEHADNQFINMVSFMKI